MSESVFKCLRAEPVKPIDEQHQTILFFIQFRRLD